MLYRVDFDQAVVPVIDGLGETLVYLFDYYHPGSIWRVFGLERRNQLISVPTV